MLIYNEEDVIRLVSEDEWMMDILRSAKSLNLPDWWVCAGFVRSKIWDVLHEFNERTPLPDIDVIYFDEVNVDEKIEKSYEQILNRLQPNIPWSVKNQARMHSVNNIYPYSSSVDAIAKFPETATALGVKLDERGKVLLTAPHGISDVINCHIRPTPFFNETKEGMVIYEDRVHKKKWKSIWSKVEVL
ncbi:nucleotidyltransferase family protein [Sporosarcina thermotolerans]|uniref:Nucleotidyltransferase family protein n=1 Tax=Sporosarcina thermotolerans TaxID=633404 RepID=A0AAW9A7Z5_9BACL|nr:nucleotidyltransferase family protein [Sporosarcina thermotolerans]MDW0115960.1 nucleotidyltransferase family protein [Sporosarcina thermotolerans]WHT46832.1 nucleotidyltransferase family protein [Sporosarcina thermotolerans]